MHCPAPGYKVVQVMNPGFSCAVVYGVWVMVLVVLVVVRRVVGARVAAVRLCVVVCVVVFNQKYSKQQTMSSPVL